LAAVAALLFALFVPAANRTTGSGTVILLVSSRDGAQLSSPLPLRVVGIGGDAGKVSGSIPAAPQYREVGRVTAAAGRYKGVTAGGATIPLPIDVQSGQVTPVLLAMDSSGVLSGGAYAGSDEFNLGLSELAGKLVPLPDFSLVDQEGKVINRASLIGTPVVIAAFHTTCHETCPLYTGTLLQLRQKLGTAVRVVEVTTDPITDQPPVLAEYAKKVGADWTFATGTPEQVAAFWAPFGVTLSNGDTHTSAMIVADAHGFQRIAYRGAPDVGNSLPPSLVQQLDAAGFQQMASHGTGWSAQSIADALDAIGSSSMAKATTSGGSRAPVFTAPGLDGGRVMMDSYQGRPVVVNFFASWCNPCRDELPLLQKYAASNPSVQFVLFDYMDDTGSAKRLLDQAGVHVPVVAIDSDGQYARAYGVFGLPTTVFVRSDGTIESTVRAQLDDGTLAGHLSRITGPG
jgi:cytochrome oxidase Cu insertion factor (SCO1/SenC/PrrC family)/thiol-disulfide isomerase/thioredoxin